MPPRKETSRRSARKADLPKKCHFAASRRDKWSQARLAPGAKRDQRGDIPVIMVNDERAVRNDHAARRAVQQSATSGWPGKSAAGIMGRFSCNRSTPWPHTHPSHSRRSRLHRLCRRVRHAFGEVGPTGRLSPGLHFRLLRGGHGHRRARPGTADANGDDRTGAARSAAASTSRSSSTPTRATAIR